jgi:hypothetical protein
MPGGRPLTFFTCANCGALYQLVKGEAGPESVSRDVACRSCGASMPGRDGELILKYFHLRDGSRRWQKGKRP